MLGRIAILVFLCEGCITASNIHAKNKPCRATLDCPAGQFCIAQRCQSQLDSAKPCATQDDCSPNEACVGGSCSRSGCDADHPCQGGCCSSGICEDGTGDLACGQTGSSCPACAPGTACTDHLCTCSTCIGNTICQNNGCVDCTTQPCSGTTPVCDAETHACQPCAHDPSVCTGATPYCNDDGSCGASPLTSSACQRKDPLNPTLIASNVCSCNQSSPCPNGLGCNDTDNPGCYTHCPGGTQNCAAGNFCVDGTRCEPKRALGGPCSEDLQCADGVCGCGDAACTPSSKICTTLTCATCNYADTTGACGASGPSGARPINAFQTTPACGGSGTTDFLCDGAGSCKLVLGAVCTANNDCASGHCVHFEATGASKKCGMPNCNNCQYTTDLNGSTCTAIPGYGATTSDCVNGFQCDGSGSCKISNGYACGTVGSSCLSGVCSCVDPTCSPRTCVPSDFCYTGTTKSASCTWWSGDMNGWTGNVCGPGCTTPACGNVNNGTPCGGFAGGLSCSGGECKSVVGP